MFGIQIEDFMNRLLFCTPCHLNPRLFPDANIASRRPVLWPFLKRQGENCQTAYSIHVPCVELFLLELADSCHEREVIISSSLCITLGPPAANRTMLRRFRVAVSRATVVLDGVFQTTLYVPVIRSILRDPIRLGFESITWRDDVHVFRPFTLNGSKALRIQRQLKDRGRFRFPSEFAVVNLIRPWPQFAC